MRVAARFGDYWATIGDYDRGEIDTNSGIELVREQMDELDAACGEVGRDPTTLRRLVLTGPLIDPSLTSRAAFLDGAGRFAEIGVTDLVVHWPRPTQPYEGDEAIFEAIFSG